MDMNIQQFKDYPIQLHHITSIFYLSLSVIIGLCRFKFDLSETNQAPSAMAPSSVSSIVSAAPGTQHRRRKYLQGLLELSSATSPPTEEFNTDPQGIKMHQGITASSRHLFAFQFVLSQIWRQTNAWTSARTPPTTFPTAKNDGQTWPQKWTVLEHVGR